MQQQGRLTVGAELLFAGQRIEERIAFTRPQARIAGRGHIGIETGAGLQGISAALCPGSEGFAIDHHQRGQQRQRNRHRYRNPPPRQANRPQRSQLGGRRQLAQAHQRANHRSHRKQCVGTTRQGICHPRQGMAETVMALADLPGLAGQGHDRVQAQQHHPHHQHREQHGTAYIDVMNPRQQPHAFAPARRRLKRPSRKYSHTANSSNGRVSHHIPASTGSLPAASHWRPRMLRLTPTV